MNERKFLEQLEKRMQEQEKIMHEMIFSSFFLRVSNTLGTNPWKILVPTSLILSLVLQVVLQKEYDDAILKIFGGFGIIHLR